MAWSKRTEKLWQAFENAVLARDKKQFEIFNEYRKSKKLDEKANNQTAEEELNLF